MIKKMELAYSNMRNGNWDGCTIDEIQIMCEHWEKQISIHEENMTIKQLDHTSKMLLDMKYFLKERM